LSFLGHLAYFDRINSVHGTKYLVGLLVGGSVHCKASVDTDNIYACALSWSPMHNHIV